MRQTMNGLLRWVILPKTISAFERQYLARMTKIALAFFYAHVPAMMLVAWLAGTSIARAGLYSAAILVGPTLAYRFFHNPRMVTRAFGFTAMCMGGVLVHFGQGPMQIEMHFYFFVLIALLAVFADPLVIIVAAVTVALHHLAGWLILPTSVFNYDASLWAVVVHALFVVLESVAACFVARSFFDNVIGLERKVQARTQELGERGRQMSLVLDNVDQGLGIAMPDGKLNAQTSRILRERLGAPAEGEHLWTWLARRDAKAAAWLEVGWQMFADDLLPVEVVLDQLPKRMTADGRFFSIAYRPLGTSSSFEGLLFVITDVSNEVAREREEMLHREALAIFERALRDRMGVEEFWHEAEEIVSTIESSTSREDVNRALHTLKGNAAVIGCEALARLCHEIEDRAAETGAVAREDIAGLRKQWNELEARLASFLGTASNRSAKIEVDVREHQAAVDAVQSGASKAALVEMLESWKLEPAQVRLARLGDSARRLAQRLGKGDVAIDVDGAGVRLSPTDTRGLWTSLVHIVRNAADHGLEDAAERERGGKKRTGRISLRAYTDASNVYISVDDDGRGISWSDVRIRAAALGLPCETPQDLEDALFADGLSTVAVANEYSGRGVGMSVVRAECEKLGGRVRVQSERGRGTSIQIVLPRTQAADSGAMAVARLRESA